MYHLFTYLAYWNKIVTIRKATQISSRLRTLSVVTPLLYNADAASIAFPKRIGPATIMVLYKTPPTDCI